jgi:hypothetical protein
LKSVDLLLSSASLCAGEMAIAFAEAGMTLPPWRHHRSMLSKWLPSHARTVRIVPPAERGPSDGAPKPADCGPAGPAGNKPEDTAQSRPSRAPGAGDETTQRSTADSRQSPVRPRAAQAGPGASSRPAKRAHAAQPASSTGASSEIPAGTDRPAGSSLRRSSLLSKELEAQRAPPTPKAQQPSTAESSLRADSAGGRSGLSRHSGGGDSSDGSTHGATAACPRIRTVKLRGSGSGGGGSSGGRTVLPFALPPATTAA